MSKPRIAPGGDIRVGLIGYGLAGAVFHAPLIAATPGLRLATIVTGEPGAAGAGARSEHPGVAVVGRRRTSCGSAPAELDLVVVASPNRTHVPLALAALEAGLPVVVDKPLAATAAEARAAGGRGAPARGLLLTVFQNRRWDGDFLTLRRLLAEGALGDVLPLRVPLRALAPGAEGRLARARRRPAEAGGLLYDLGSHLVDQALVLFGPVATVYAELDRRRPGVEVDDDAFIALTHAARRPLAPVDERRRRAARPALPGAGQPRRVREARPGRAGGGAARRRARRLGPAGAWSRRERWGRLGAGDDGAPVPTEPGDYPRFYAGVAAALRTARRRPSTPRTRSPRSRSSKPRAAQSRNGISRRVTGGTRGTACSSSAPSGDSV